MRSNKVKSGRGLLTCCNGLLYGTEKCWLLLLGKLSGAPVIERLKCFAEVFLPDLLLIWNTMKMKLCIESYS